MDPILTALRASYSDEQIAAALSSSPRRSERSRALRRWENGEFEPRLSTLRRLAVELGCEVLIAAWGIDVRHANGAKIVATVRRATVPMVEG